MRLSRTIRMRSCESVGRLSRFLRQFLLLELAIAAATWFYLRSLGLTHDRMGGASGSAFVDPFATIVSTGVGSDVGRYGGEQSQGRVSAKATSSSPSPSFRMSRDDVSHFADVAASIPLHGEQNVVVDQSWSIKPGFWVIGAQRRDHPLKNRHWGRRGAPSVNVTTLAAPRVATGRSSAQHRA